MWLFIIDRQRFVTVQGGSAEVELKKGQQIRLSTNKAFESGGNVSAVFVDYPNITKVVKPGNRVYVDDGLISLIVNRIGTLDNTYDIFK